MQYAARIQKHTPVLRHGEARLYTLLEGKQFLSLFGSKWDISYGVACPSALGLSVVYPVTRPSGVSAGAIVDSAS